MDKHTTDEITEKICKYTYCSKQVSPEDVAKSKAYCCDRHRQLAIADRKRKRYKPVKKPFVSIQVLCPCGCWRFFWTEKRAPSRKYFVTYPCRHIHYRKLRGDKVGDDHVISKETDKPFRATICHRKGIFSDDRVACHRYSECSDGEFTGLPWIYERNGGEDCYLVPHHAPENTLGGSFDLVVSRGYSFV